MIRPRGPSADVLRRLARESGRLLAEMGVRSGDEEWIRREALTLSSLAGEWKGIGLAERLQRWARRAARTAR